MDLKTVFHKAPKPGRLRIGKRVGMEYKGKKVIEAKKDLRNKAEGKSARRSQAEGLGWGESGREQACTGHRMSDTKTAAALQAAC